MNNDNLFLVLEHINDFKENKYRDLRAKVLNKDDRKQLCLLERVNKKNSEIVKKAKLKIIN